MSKISKEASAFIQVSALARAFQIGDQTIHALRGVDLSIQSGEFCIIRGQSGSGKSSLLYLLGGLDRATSGQVQIEDCVIGELDENQLAQFRRKTMGFIFQSYNLITSMTALENVMFPMVFSGVSKVDRLACAKQMLAHVGLEDRMKHRPSELSGGQQQRVAIARALVNHPTLILADEPTGNLDTTSGKAVMDILQNLNKNQGVTIVLVTHNPNLIEYATQIVDILDGQIVQTLFSKGNTS
ncbi:MAG: ABC transporter ATP-binding protein [Anaerolineaceae bacterium]|nr:ABC transporter ATP-binding protein [Anaerolineaceae bacterium]